MEIWILALGAAVAGLVQGIAGFAFAMVAMSIWVWGVNPQVAAVMAVFGGWAGQVIAVRCDPPSVTVAKELSCDGLTWCECLNLRHPRTQGACKDVP